MGLGAAKEAPPSQGKDALGWRGREAGARVDPRINNHVVTSHENGIAISPPLPLKPKPTEQQRPLGTVLHLQDAPLRFSYRYLRNTIDIHK